MNKRKILIQYLSQGWMMVALFVILLLPLIIGIALSYKSGPIFRLCGLDELFLSTTWKPTGGQFGFLPFIVSSLYVTIISFILSAPVCILAAIYLTQFASKKLISFMLPVIDILAGIPSVVYGMWGILIVVPFVGETLAPLFNVNSSGYTILSGGIVLAVMCIPYVLNMLIESFKTVPTGLVEATLSLGATKWESIKHSVLRKCSTGIISAFGLGLAKAFGETLAVMMVVGNVVQITGNPLEAGYPLPALIANNYGEMLSIPMYDSALMLASLILLVIVMLINLFFRYLIYKTQKR